MHSKANKWTREDVEFLERNLGSMTYADIGAALGGRSSKSVAAKIDALKLKRQPRTRFTPEMDDYIFAYGCPAAVARFGIPYPLVKSRRQYLKKKLSETHQPIFCGPPRPPHHEDTIVQRWIPAAAAPMPRTTAARSVFELAAEC
jgi:hypothetical protein